LLYCDLCIALFPLCFFINFFDLHTTRATANQSDKPIEIMFPSKKNW